MKKICGEDDQYHANGSNNIFNPFGPFHSLVFNYIQFVAYSTVDAYESIAFPTASAAKVP